MSWKCFSSKYVHLQGQFDYADALTKILWHPSPVGGPLGSSTRKFDDLYFWNCNHVFSLPIFSCSPLSHIRMEGGKPFPCLVSQKQKETRGRQQRQESLWSMFCFFKIQSLKFSEGTRWHKKILVNCYEREQRHVICCLQQRTDR